MSCDSVTSIPSRPLNLENEPYQRDGRLVFNALHLLSSQFLSMVARWCSVAGKILQVSIIEQKFRNDGRLVTGHFETDRVILP